MTRAPSRIRMASMNARLNCILLFFALVTLPMPLSSAYSAPATLFRRLGGKRKIALLVSDYVNQLAGDSRLLEDPRLKKLSDQVDRRQVKRALAQRVCQASGGPCPRAKVSIRNFPSDLQLNAFEWIYVVEDLNTVLNRHHVPDQEQRDLVNLLLQAHGGS